MEDAIYLRRPFPRTGRLGGDDRQQRPELGLEVRAGVGVRGDCVAE
eukprot:SAG31_NODE_3268_length_4478_cov_2.701987_4_plen_46_part_00